MTSIRTRRFINDATRQTNLDTIIVKGVEQITAMYKESLVDLGSFKYFLVYMFQEVVAEDVTKKIFDKLTALESDDLEVALTEIAERYIQFARLGYVITVKNYIDAL